MKKNCCKDCKKEINSGKFCDKCLSIWYVENNIEDDIPSGDFEENDWRRNESQD